MTIDAEKLAAAVAYYDNDCRPAAPQFYTILEAARAHLATLPRYKEVEVVSYVTLAAKGEVWFRGGDEKDAHDSIPETAPSGWQVVRLTGTAKVRA